MTIAALTASLGVQLAASKRTRSMLKRTLHTMMFGCTFFGLIIVIGILLVKMKLNKPAAVQATA